VPSESDKPDELKLGNVDYQYFHDLPGTSPITADPGDAGQPEQNTAAKQSGADIWPEKNSPLKTAPAATTSSQQILKMHSFHGTRVAQALTGLALLAFIALPIIAMGKAATVCFLVFIGIIIAVMATVKQSPE